MADWVDVVRLIHVVTVSLWVGGGIFALSMILPAVGAAGMPGKGFMMAVVRRGGFGKFFGPVSGLGILSGLALFYGRGYHTEPFGDAASATLTVGAIIGIFAFAEGLAVNMPTERKMKAIVDQLGAQGPTPEQAKQMEALAKKSQKAAVRSVAMISLAFLLMVGRVLLL